MYRFALSWQVGRIPDEVVCDCNIWYELVWHRDRNDRIVEILESDGWYFQFEDQLPTEMKKGDVLNIPKESYHRIIKGSNDLVVKIYEI